MKAVQNTLEIWRRGASRAAGNNRSGTSATLVCASTPAGQFAIVGGFVMLAAMFVVGNLLAKIVSQKTTENHAASTALLMDSFLSPRLQKLASSDNLTTHEKGELDQLFGRERFRDRFPHLEIWKQGGLVAYSTTPNLIGQRFEEPDGLNEALSGQVTSRYTNLLAKEHEVRKFTKKFLEIYVPIREHRSDRIIAVAEIHEITEPLEEKLWWVWLKTWLAVAGATVLIMASLLWIVYRGSRLLVNYQRHLQKRMVEIEQVSRKNEDLRRRVERASGRAAEATEDHLKRIGAELHDGPAQLIGLAALKVEHVRRADTWEKRNAELDALETALSDALNEIRALSRGLMLPEIGDLPLTEVVLRAVRSHEERTSTSVVVDFCGSSPVLSPAARICAYRFVQEGLNNAFRHAGGAGQAVSCRFENSTMVLAVEDCGGEATTVPTVPHSGLGLIGLRERVESLGGSLQISARSDGGTRIEMKLDVSEGGLCG